MRILPRTGKEKDDIWLITTAPVDPAVLGRATRVWERLARNGQDANVLAPLLEQIKPVRMHVADDVDLSVPGRVFAMSWVYKVLGWRLAERLASRPIDFDGRKVPFRLDTNGDLIAWDDPISLPLHGGGTARGMVKISLGIKTLPGVGDVVCIPQVSFSRLVDDLRKVKGVWIDHGRSAGGSALLRLPVAARRAEGRWEHIFRDYSGPVVEACGLTPLPWGENVLAEHPDRVRASRSVNWSHPLGAGVGARTYLRLMDHAAEVLGVEPVTYAPTRIKVLSDQAIENSAVAGDDLDAAVASAGYDRLRIVHLSARPATRERVRLALGACASDGVPPLSPEVGVVQRLTRRTETVAYDVPTYLQHDVGDRSGLFRSAPMLRPDPGTLVLALVDTEYDNDDVEGEDAKPALRRALAKIGVTSQFIAIPPGSDGSRPTPRKKPAPGKEKSADRDYPVIAAVRDLQRTGGLTDGRLARAVTLSPFPLDRAAWLVGVHVRVQNTVKTPGSGSGGRPLLVTVLVAVHAYPDADRPWDFMIHIPGQGWLQHAAGLAAFHAGAIGRPIDNRQRSLAELRGYVDGALAELPSEDPVVLMTDADSTRRVWSGLSDQHLRGGVLPGASLATAHRIAVVRVGVADDAVPRPVDRTTGRLSSDPGKPNTPDNRLYELVGDDGGRSWLLGQASRTFKGGRTGRVGADFTRFTLPPERANEQRENWHAFTGTEFVVAERGVFDEPAVAALTARLCAQPLSWDSRTRLPLPLHMADIADETHPSYRAPSEDEVDDMHGCRRPIDTRRGLPD